MMTPAEKVTWALRFAGMRLDRIEPASRQHVVDDIRAVLADVPFQWGDEPFTPPRVLAIQKEVRDLVTAVGLASFLGTYPPPTPLPFIGTMREGLRQHATEKRTIGEQTIMWSRPFTSIRGLILVNRPAGGTVLLQGDLTEMLLYSLAVALVTIGQDQVLLCPACEYPFVPQHGHQRFCSTLCKNRTALADFRRREREAKAKQPKARKRTG